MAEDTISRQAAIDACLKGKMEGLPATNVACDCCAERIRVLPTVEQTLYGYNIEHLAFIAALLQKENISPEELKYMLTDIRIMMQFVINDITDTIQREICQ